MRRVPARAIGVILAVASGAIGRGVAAPGRSIASAGGAGAGAPTTTVWADWVGEWAGKLRWQGCAIDGAASATISIDASDGAVAIDLASAGVGLASVRLVEDDTAWVGQSADVRVHAARSKGALELGVTLDSGCELHATLHRDGSGIAQCDRLAAWGRVEARCSKLARPPLEEPARLARQRAAWSTARGGDRELLASQCDARASRVEAELVGVGCAPNPDPAIGLRALDCQAMQQAMSRLGRCAAAPTDEVAALARVTTELASAAQTAREAELPFVEAQCRAQRERVALVAHQAGCPL
jgi:hypothetical protein